MTSDGRCPVAIVGGGASGTILAAQLARRGIGSVLIDGSGRAGHGVAYSTNEPAHLLNVRAEGMSAWAEDPAISRRGSRPRAVTAAVSPNGACSAAICGEILEHAIGIDHASVEQATAVGARRDGGAWQVELDDGRTLAAVALVLATGNQEPEPLRVFDGIGDRGHQQPVDAARPKPRSATSRKAAVRHC